MLKIAVIINNDITMGTHPAYERCINKNLNISVMLVKEKVVSYNITRTHINVFERIIHCVGYKRGGIS